MDLGNTFGLVDPMDEAKRDLIIQLATQAGMLLEHASAPLILLPSQPDDELLALLNRSADHLERASKLIKAAQSIVE